MKTNFCLKFIRRTHPLQLFQMKKQKKQVSQKGQKASIKSRLKMPISEYSQLYCKYMIEEYPAVDMMIKKIIQMPCCRQYYLKFPLQSLLRGVVKKLMLNTYQIGVYGYFLQQIDTWMMPGQLYLNVSEVFPDVIHVNEPTSQSDLKQLSMFLYFSSYSIKQLLNPSIEMYKYQMQKLFQQFEHLHTHWVNSQPTVNMVLSPRFLNEYFKKIEKVKSLVDYNTCVDKIIQISPCYDLSARTEKVKGRDFGYMGEQVREYNGYAGFLMDNDVKVEMEQIYNINDFKYDGSNI